MNKLFNKLNDIFLLVFVFALNFEYWDPVGLKGVFSIAKMSGILYILSWLPLFKLLNFSKVQKFLIPLVLYMLIEFFSSLFYMEYASTVGEAINLKLLQMFFLLILISNHILRRPEILMRIFDSFILSVLLMALLSYLGFGVGLDYQEGVSRLSLFGENPNMIGMKATFAFLIVIYRIISLDGKTSTKALYCVVLIPLIYLLISTASRGALVSVFLGLFVLIFFQKSKVTSKILFAFLGVLFSVGLFNYVLSTNEKFKKRIEATIEEGDTGRNELWDAAFDIIEDHIFIGVGKAGALPIMGKYSGRAMDTHNVFLYVLVTSGIVGFTFFITYIFRLIFALYKKFKQDNNILYLVLFVILVFNMSKAGGFINKTFLWFFFAILIGAAIRDTRKHELNLAVFRR